MGVTGTRATVGERAEKLVKDTRAAGATHVCVGLGVSTGDQAAEVGRWADGVIVGSVLVRPLLDDDPWARRLENVSGITRELVSGVRRAGSEVGVDPVMTPDAPARTTARGAVMASTMSLPGDDEEIRDSLDVAIRAREISDTEVEMVLRLLDENPGRFRSYAEIYAKAHAAAISD
jgi:tryptophan synthase alpha chain